MTTSNYMPDVALAFNPTGRYDPPPESKGWIRLLDPADVGADLANVVLDAAEAAARALALPFEVVAHFFEPCAADHPNAIGPSTHVHAQGFVVRPQPGHFCIRAGLEHGLAERVTVHELRHVWQHLHGLEAAHSHADLERDAHAFDAQWMGCPA